MSLNVNLSNSMKQLPPPVSTQALVWATPAGYFPGGFGSNIQYRNVNALGNQMTDVHFRTVTAYLTDPTASATERTVTIIGQNGDPYEIIFPSSCTLPYLGCGVLSAGAAVDVESLQVGI